MMEFLSNIHDSNTDKEEGELSDDDDKSIQEKSIRVDSQSIARRKKRRGRRKQRGLVLDQGGHAGRHISRPLLRNHRHQCEESGLNSYCSPASDVRNNSTIYHDLSERRKSAFSGQSRILPLQKRKTPHHKRAASSQKSNLPSHNKALPSQKMAFSSKIFKQRNLKSNTDTEDELRRLEEEYEQIKKQLKLLDEEEQSREQDENAVQSSGYDSLLDVFESLDGGTEEGKENIPDPEVYSQPSFSRKDLATSSNLLNELAVCEKIPPTFTFDEEVTDILKDPPKNIPVHYGLRKENNSRNMPPAPAKSNENSHSICAHYDVGVFSSTPKPKQKQTYGKEWQCSNNPFCPPFSKRLYTPSPVSSCPPSYNLLYSPSSNPLFSLSSSPLCSPSSNPACSPSSNPVCSPSFNGSPSSNPLCSPSSNPLCSPSSNPLCSPFSNPLCSPSSKKRKISPPAVVPPLKDASEVISIPGDGCTRWDSDGEDPESLRVRLLEEVQEKRKSVMKIFPTGSRVQQPSIRSTALQSPGSTALQSPGSAALQSPAESSALQSPAESAALQSPAESSALRSPAESAALQSPVFSAAHQSPAESATLQSSVFSAAHQSPVFSAAHQLPVFSAAHQSPVFSAAHQSPAESAALQSPGFSAAHQSLTWNAALQSPAWRVAHQSLAGSAAVESLARNTAHQSLAGSAAAESLARNKAHQSLAGSAAVESLAGNTAHQSLAGSAAVESLAGNKAHQSLEWSAENLSPAVYAAPNSLAGSRTQIFSVMPKVQLSTCEPAVQYSVASLYAADSTAQISQIGSAAQMSQVRASGYTFSAWHATSGSLMSHPSNSCQGSAAYSSHRCMSAGPTKPRQFKQPVWPPIHPKVVITLSPVSDSDDDDNQRETLTEGATSSVEPLHILGNQDTRKPDSFGGTLNEAEGGKGMPQILHDREQKLASIEQSIQAHKKKNQMLTEKEIENRKVLQQKKKERYHLVSRLKTLKQEIKKRTASDTFYKSKMEATQKEIQLLEKQKEECQAGITGSGLCEPAADATSVKSHIVGHSQVSETDRNQSLSRAEYRAQEKQKLMEREKQVKETLEKLKKGVPKINIRKSSRFVLRRVQNEGHFKKELSENRQNGKDALPSE